MRKPFKIPESLSGYNQAGKIAEYLNEREDVSDEVRADIAIILMGMIKEPSLYLLNRELINYDKDLVEQNFQGEEPKIIRERFIRNRRLTDLEVKSILKIAEEITA